MKSRIYTKASAQDCREKVTFLYTCLSAHRFDSIFCPKVFSVLCFVVCFWFFIYAIFIGFKDSAYYCLCAHYLRIAQCISHAIHSPSREYSIFATCCFKSSVNDRKRKQNGHFIRNKCENKRRQVFSYIPKYKRLTH